jgi:anti-sigma-K factor RskA
LPELEMDMNEQQQPGKSKMTTTGGNPVDCEEALALVPAYSVGAADDDEMRLVQAALTQCPEVAAELESYQEMLGGMLHSAPYTAPPPALREKLLRAAINPLAQPIAASAKALPAESRTPAVQAAPRRLALSWPAAAAAVVLLLGSNLLWLNQVDQLRQGQITLNARLDEQTALINLLGEGDLARVSLPAGENTDAPFATVVYSPNARYGVLYNLSLAALTPEQAYQLWLIDAEGNPTSAAVFQVGDDDGQSWIWQMEQPVGGFSAFAISIEPAGGSPSPTTTPISIATL